LLSLMLKVLILSADLMTHVHQMDVPPPTAPAPGLNGPSAQTACAPDREHAPAAAATAIIRPQHSLRPADPASPQQPQPQPQLLLTPLTPLHRCAMVIMRNGSATTTTSSAMKPAAPCTT